MRKEFPKTTRRTINLSQATSTSTLNKEPLSTLCTERKKRWRTPVTASTCLTDISLLQEPSLAPRCKHNLCQLVSGATVMKRRITFFIKKNYIFLFNVIKKKKKCLTPVSSVFSGQIHQCVGLWGSCCPLKANQGLWVWRLFRRRMKCLTLWAVGLWALPVQSHYVRWGESSRFKWQYLSSREGWRAKNHNKVCM